MVQVVVERADGRGSGWVRVGGELHLARFPAHLPEGARFPARVEAAGPPVVLRLEPPQQDPTAALFRTPAQPLPEASRTLAAVPDAPPELSSLLDRLAGFFSGRPTAGTFLRLLGLWTRQSGVFHEAALARGASPDDLKALALGLLSRVPDGELSRSLEALVRHVAVAQGRSLAEGVPVLPLVLPWGDRWVAGALRWGGGRRGRGKGAGGHLSVSLDLPRLGPTEIRVGWGQVGVSVRIALEPERVPDVAERLAELGDALTRAAGVRVVTLAAVSREPRRPDPAGAVLEIVA